ncbi:ACP S-malonyltransferase [Paenibacillus sp. TRM 82003]|uniref:ACP S-malonyltransferase n=1 Tax=Kineococcus sp. TRM81007 TaxID=2925831 RepID=UPI001F59762A|nr:ACP S-malonyltransferase [Kineococcus sp. TRM81007]MCI2240155.1 ACP S-malonyltransferase [Kineococcus sp. TRM81007]MCI3925538.1 ACP S-malonyltransferase [Paenibacillus sp. TRM 82003]
MLVFVFPGQGSQSPGFLAPWLELPGVADRLRWASAVVGDDLVAHGTVSDAETLRDTAVAQPLIVAAGLVALRELVAGPAELARVAGAVAGHSVGELTAAAAAGALTPEQALVLVRERGRAMAAAAAVRPTGMSAVLGGDPAEVAAALERLGLTAANDNGGGQVVAAGELGALAALADQPPAKARVVPLQVAGAFHTEHMAPAAGTLGQLAAGLEPGTASVPLAANADGELVTDGGELLRRLVAQVGRPVRWDLCTESFRRLGVTALIELAPAGTLVNLAKRQLKGIDVLALKTPADLERARTMIAEHGATPVATSGAGDVQ